MNKSTKLSISLITLSLITGCATWSTATVENTPDSSKVVSSLEAKKTTSVNDIKISEADITERPYKSIGDISVTVNKTTIFNPDPTKEMVNEKLREKAFELGADAVVLVRYGTVGISFVSWGSLDGKGRAVKFVR